MKHLFQLLAFSFIAVGTIHSQSTSSEVKIQGAMKNVMRKGELHGTIKLDTIQSKSNLYGLGPLEYLKGELLVYNGISYVSKVSTNGTVLIEKTYQVQAPFFVYSNVETWIEINLPKNIRTLQQLENFLNVYTQNMIRPFAFRLEGEFELVKFHIQNLPDNSIIRSPEDAHVGQGKYSRMPVKGKILGFFSTEHQTIFTHHDSYIHMHFINELETEMGHIDDLLIQPKGKVKLYLPSNIKGMNK